jgi:CRP-like cAMP-binding protein
MKYEKIYTFANSISPVERELWEEFETGFTQHSFKKSELITQPDDEAEVIYFILEGVCRNYFTSVEGREYTKIFSTEGAMIGPYMEILAGTKSKYYIQAVTSCKLVGMRYDAFEERMAKHHSWERLGRKIAEGQYMEKEQREFMLMHMNIEQKYKFFTEMYEDHLDKIPQYQIASYLGVTPEALNRFLKKR